MSDKSNAVPLVKTTFFEKVSYGMGDVACNVVVAITSSLLIYCYTNVIGISAALVGSLMLASRIFDGISDLIMAQVMDKVNSKLGKYRAWVLWTAIPYGISAVALVCIPPHATTAVQAVYIFVTYNLCTTVCYTALNLPYSALAPTMTNDEDDLAKINIFRMSMSPIGNMIVTAVTLPFINRLGGDQKAWITVTAVYAVIAFFMLLLTFVKSKERFMPKSINEAADLPFTKRLKAAFTNKYFLILCLTTIAAALYQNVNGVCTTYYAQYILGNVELMGALQTAEKIPWIIGIMVLAPFITRLGKRNMILIGSALCLIGQAVVLFAPENYMALMIAAVLRGFGEAPFYGCCYTMIADAIDYGHWRTGVRVHSLLFSASTVGLKFGSGVAAWVIGQLLTMSGFTGAAAEIPSAISMIKNLYIWGSIIAWAAIFILMLVYKLDKEHKQIVADLAERGQL